jgi:hypothetical protein
MAVIAFWGRWMAPRSAHRIGMLPRRVVALALFSLAAIGLYEAGHPQIAGAGLAIAVVNQLLLATVADS